MFTKWTTQYEKNLENGGGKEEGKVELVIEKNKRQFKKSACHN